MAQSCLQYFVKASDNNNEWHLRANWHDERIVDMVCVEQKHLFVLTRDGSVKRLADGDPLQFVEIDFRNR